jgi:hypothetical protein
MTLKLGSSGPYLKCIMAAFGTLLTGLSVYYGHTQWFPVVTSLVSAVSVYLVPNTPKAVPEPVVPPAYGGPAAIHVPAHALTRAQVVPDDAGQ